MKENVCILPKFDPNTSIINDWLDWICLTHLPLEKMAAILADDNFKCMSLNENYRIPILVSLKFIPRSRIDNMPALVQVMAWHWTGNKLLPELMLTQFTDAYMRH